MPVPKKGTFDIQDVHSREIRVLLFDEKLCQYIGNTYIIPASSSKDGAQWMFDYNRATDLARSFLVKVQGSDL